MRIYPTIICISIWIAFGLALATGAMAQAGDKDSIVVILRPGLEKGQIETALDAARGTGAGLSPCAGKTPPRLQRRLRPPCDGTASGMPSRTASRLICKD